MAFSSTSDPADADAAPTKKVTDSYELLEAVGEGAYATVFRARHRRTGRLVAVKTIDKHASCLRLLEGDQRIIEAVHSGELGNLNQTKAPRTVEETLEPLEVKP